MSNTSYILIAVMFRKICFFNYKTHQRELQTLTPVSRTRTLNEVKRNSSEPVGTAVSVTRLSEPGVVPVGTITLIVKVETVEVEVVFVPLQVRPIIQLKV